MAGLGVESGQWIDAPHGTCGQGTGLSSLLGGAMDQQLVWLWAVGRLPKGLWATWGRGGTTVSHKHRTWAADPCRTGCYKGPGKRLSSCLEQEGVGTLPVSLG